MDKKSKLENLPENIDDKGKQFFLNKNDRVGDNPNKMVIGSGTSFKGSDINTDYIEIYGKVETSIHSKIIYVGTLAEIIGPITCDHIEIHGSVSGGIQVNGKATIKKSATVVGTLRYELISVEEGASVYSDLHCTKADQKLVDKISHLKKTMNQSNLSTISSLIVEEKDNPKEENVNIEKEKKKKRSFF
jgi:Integral membrane protein CcmA involved in cell shape determination